MNELVARGQENGQTLQWYPVRVRTSVENVIRGDVNTSTVEYSYWLSVGTKVGEWNHALEGSRYIYFLRRDREGLRSVVDFWPSAIRVTTGRHTSLPKDAALSEAIARILLLPGEFFDPREYNLSDGISKSTQLIGEGASLKLVKTLVENDNPDVRKAACFELKRYTRQDHCDQQQGSPR